MPKVENLFRTAEEWTTKNPKLGAGQVGKEKYTKKYKVGDGIRRWNELDYSNGLSENTYLNAWQGLDASINLFGAVVSVGGGKDSLDEYVYSVMGLLTTPEAEAWLMDNKANYGSDLASTNALTSDLIGDLFPDFDRRLNIGAIIVFLVGSVVSHSDALTSIGGRLSLIENVNTNQDQAILDLQQGG